MNEAKPTRRDAIALLGALPLTGINGPATKIDFSASDAGSVHAPGAGSRLLRAIERLDATTLSVSLLEEAIAAECRKQRIGPASVRGIRIAARLGLPEAESIAAEAHADFDRLAHATLARRSTQPSDMTAKIILLDLVDDRDLLLSLIRDIAEMSGVPMPVPRVET